MRISLHQQQEISGSRHAASFGRIGRSINATSVESAARSSANDATAVPAEVATALRTLAAGGFGDALTVTDYWNRSRTRLDAAARAHRSRVIGRILASIARGVVDHVRRMMDRIERRSQMRATALTLAGLDSRALRDLGFDRSEVHSVAAELGGDVHTTRVRVALTLRGR